MAAIAGRVVIVKIKKILNNFFIVVGSFSYRLTGLRDPGLNCVPVVPVFVALIDLF